MANPGYLRSTDGDNADDGSTLALANATLAGATADHAAGDRIWTSDNHSESTAGVVTVTLPGTPESPNQLLCGDDSAEPPTALANTAVVANTGSNAMTLHGSFYCYGHNFHIVANAISSGAAMTLCGSDGNAQVYENCEFHHKATGSAGVIAVSTAGGAVNALCRWFNCRVQFNAVGQVIMLAQPRFEWLGGSFIAGTTPTNIFARNSLISSGVINALIDGVDFSALSAGVNIIAAADFCGLLTLRNCVMPASWSGTVGVPTRPGGRVELFNVAAAVASGQNNFSLWIADYAGSVKHETTIVRTGGASDGDTPIAWRMDTDADAEYPAIPLRSPEIAVRMTSTGSKTLRVHFIADENVAAGQGAGSGNAFRNDEWWLEVRYLGTTDSPKGTLVAGAPSVVTTPTDHAASSETWTTTGMTTPQKQYIEQAITVNEECVVMVTICGGKASKTAYFCPKVEVS